MAVLPPSQSPIRKICLALILLVPTSAQTQVHTMLLSRAETTCQLRPSSSPNPFGLHPETCMYVYIYIYGSSCLGQPMFLSRKQQLAFEVKMPLGGPGPQKLHFMQLGVRVLGSVL